jgi:hypothetical protein
MSPADVSSFDAIQRLCQALEIKPTVWIGFNSQTATWFAACHSLPMAEQHNAPELNAALANLVAELRCLAMAKQEKLAAVAELIAGPVSS